MTRIAAGCVLALSAVLLCSRTAAADVVYLEGFPNVGNLPTQGWAGRGELTNSANVIALPGGGVEARVASAGGYTYLYGNLQGDETAEFVFYTDEFPIDPAELDITAFSWLMRNQDQSTPITGRLVVEIDGQWYATTETFVHTAGDSTWAMQSFSFDRLPGTWSHLTFDVGMSQSPSDIDVGSTLVSDLPSETITRFGLYFRTNYVDGWRAVRFTNVTVEATPVPEPTTCLLLVLGLMFTASLRRRPG